MKLSRFLLPAALLTITLAAWSCSKSNNGKPKISIESINSPIQAQEQFDALLKFSSGSKLSKGILVAIRDRLNIAPPPVGVDKSGTDTLHIPIPEFAADKGEFEFVMSYDDYLHFSDGLNDTLQFKFAAIDANGTSSDTVTSSKIVVINP